MNRVFILFLCLVFIWTLFHLETNITSFILCLDENIPKILVVPEDQIVKENETARFDCVFEPNTFIQWFFYNSEPISNSSR
jgi:hypothetical protein